MILLSTMMLPFHVRLIPMFITFRFLGWIDTYLPLIVPFFFGGVPFFIFLVRQFFLTIPLEMEDAAAIDGAGVFASFLLIILPLSRPVLGVVGVFAFIRVWNDFLEPLIYIHSMDKMTLSLGLRFFQDQDLHRLDEPDGGVDHRAGAERGAVLRGAEVLHPRRGDHRDQGLTPA